MRRLYYFYTVRKLADEFENWNWKKFNKNRENRRILGRKVRQGFSRSANSFLQWLNFLSSKTDHFQSTTSIDQNLGPSFLLLTSLTLRRVGRRVWRSGQFFNARAWPGQISKNGEKISPLKFYFAFFEKVSKSLHSTVFFIIEFFSIDFFVGINLLGLFGILILGFY